MARCHKRCARTICCPFNPPHSSAGFFVAILYKGMDNKEDDKFEQLRDDITELVNATAKRFCELGSIINGCLEMIEMKNNDIANLQSQIDALKGWHNN